MTFQNIEKQSKSQLKVLSEISSISDNLDMNFWLRGGWAIDFLLGKITRLHDDIDLITCIQNREKLEDELETAGYEKVSVKEEFRDRQSDFRKDEVEITIGYIFRLEDGNIIMNGLHEWLWRADSLSLETFNLKGISALVINPKQLLEEKEIYEQIGRPRRKKDTVSKKMLAQIIKCQEFKDS
ncbi:nucleotidyltransferase domain-containing protein [Oceanobacillus manasiensis]|uniref:nucleotidyltransferase domain-containing protein n=1 Tax=Oceanobacillus manasiensis TaxID=586413 RepID=UPI0005A90102|nr:hypothetical protein [Oceanobacillus manasiensis]